MRPSEIRLKFTRLERAQKSSKEGPRSGIPLGKLIG